MADGFAADDLTEDGFLGGRLRLMQPKAGYRAGIDPVLLAAACPARAGDRALDLGCGAGAAMLCLAARVPGVAVWGLERQPAYAALARANAARNGLAAKVVQGDVAAPPADLRGLAFDHVLMNPPWFDPAARTPAADPGREDARAGATDLAAWMALAARRLRPGGRLVAVARAAMVPALLSVLPGALGSVALRPVAPREGRAARLVLATAVKGGRAAFRLLPPFVLHEGPAHLRDGESWRPAAQAILRDGAALGWGDQPMGDSAPVRFA